MLMAALQQNVSVMLINEETNDVMGYMYQLLTLENISDDEASLDDINDDQLRKLFALFGHTANLCNIYRHYNVTESAHLFVLCVDSKYRRQGIGKNLIAFAVDFLSRLNLTPHCILTVGT